MKAAILDPDLAAVEIYPADADAIRAIYPDMQRGTVENDDSFADHPRIVLVREDPDPELSYGQWVAPGLVEKREDGRWYQTKQIVSPDIAEATSLRDQLKQLAKDVAADKRQELSAAQILTFMELDRLALDSTPTAAEYPLIAAIAQGRTNGGLPTTFAQAASSARTRQTDWIARAAVVERKYHETLARIDSANTLAEAKAIYDELEALA